MKILRLLLNLFKKKKIEKGVNHFGNVQNKEKIKKYLDSIK